jgi:hypothetical protein
MGGKGGDGGNVYDMELTITADITTSDILVDYGQGIGGQGGEGGEGGNPGLGGNPGDGGSQQGQPGSPGGTFGVGPRGKDGLVGKLRMII